MDNKPTPTGTEARVCEDIARRQQMGISKYGTTVAENPLALRQWLQHQYEELLDAALYCKRAIEKLDNETLKEDSAAQLLRDSLPGLSYLVKCAPIPYQSKVDWTDWQQKATAVLNKRT